MSTKEGTFPVRKSNKGVTEYLLCKPCETKLSVYENAAKKILDAQKAVLQLANTNAFNVQGIDYQKFKLFQLSILWRACISTREMFSDVELGPYKDTIRNMILDENPGRPYDFGCALFALKDEGKSADTLIQKVTKQKVKLNFSHTMYDFVFYGFRWMFVVGTKSTGALDEAFLQENGNYLITCKALSEAEHLIKSLKLMLKRESDFKK